MSVFPILLLPTSLSCEADFGRGEHQWLNPFMPGVIKDILPILLINVFVTKEFFRKYLKKNILMNPSNNFHKNY